MDMTNIVQQLNQISSAVMYATEGVDLDEVLQRIAEVSRNLIQCKYAALGIPDSHSGLAHFKVAGISDEAKSLIEHLPIGTGLIRAPMRERQVIRLEHMQDDERSAGFPAHHPHMTSLLGVPIQMGDQLFGVLYMCDKNNGEPFNDNDQQLIETLAGYAALTITSAMSNEQQSRTKVLEERERIGMELHDGIIQSLYALGMQLDLLRRTNEVNANQLTPIIGGIDTVISDIRRYIMQLRTDNKQVSVKACLREMAHKLHLSNNLDIQINAPDEFPPFPPATFQGVCLIINEAFSNAVRHSEATRIIVSAEITNIEFRVQIQDNGHGFDLSSNNSSGLGLNNMHKRALFYGGKVDVSSVRGEGTTININVPIRSY